MKTHTQAGNKSKKGAAPSKLRKRVTAVLAVLLALFVVLPSFSRYVLQSDALSRLDLLEWASRGFEVELSAQEPTPAPFFMESVLRRVIKSSVKSTAVTPTAGFTEGEINFTEGEINFTEGAIN